MAFDSSRTSVGIATEVTSGTFVAPNAFIPYDSVTVGEKFVEERDEASRYGVSTTPIDNVNMRRDGVSGTISGVLSNIGPTDRILTNAFGGRASAAAAVAGYTIETYTLSDSGPSHTIQVVRPRESPTIANTTIEDTFTSVGNRINTLSLSCEVEKTLKFDVDYLGRREYVMATETTNMTTLGFVGLLTATIAGTAVTCDNSNIAVGMTIVGGGFAGGTTVSALTATGFTASAAGTAGTANINVGFPKAVAAYTAAARPFRAAAKKMVLTIGGVEFCFGAYTLTLNNNLTTESRSCGPSEPSRQGPRSITLSVQNLEYDLRFRDWLASNAAQSIVMKHTSTTDVNTTLTITAPAVRVKGPAAPDLAVGTPKLTVDLDLEILAPSTGSDLTVALQHN